MPDRPEKNLPSSVLVVAGFDPSGCAGISADLRTLEAIHVYGAAVVTAITFQNPLEFDHYQALPVEWLDTQLDCLLRRFTPQAVKVGMLGSAMAVQWAVKHLQRGMGAVVLDPVVQASRGGELIDLQGLEILKSKLIPLAYAITPNINEAETLSGVTAMKDPEGMKAAARRIHEQGVKHVVITGGHLARECSDLWYDGKHFVILRSQRISAGPVRGTGTLFSAALAGYIASGFDFFEALLGAKKLVLQALMEKEPAFSGPLMPPAAEHDTDIEILREC